MEGEFKKDGVEAWSVMVRAAAKKCCAIKPRHCPNGCAPPHPIVFEHGKALQPEGRPQAGGGKMEWDGVVTTGAGGAKK